MGSRARGLDTIKALSCTTGEHQAKNLHFGSKITSSQPCTLQRGKTEGLQELQLFMGLLFIIWDKAQGKKSSPKADKSLFSSIHTTLLYLLVSLKFKQRCRSSQKGKMLLSSIHSFQTGLQRDATEAPRAGRFLLLVPLLHGNPSAFLRALRQEGERSLCPKLQSC